MPDNTAKWLSDANGSGLIAPDGEGRSLVVDHATAVIRAETPLLAGAGLAGDPRPHTERGEVI